MILVLNRSDTAGFAFPAKAITFRKCASSSDHRLLQGLHAGTVSGVYDNLRDSGYKDFGNTWSRVLSLLRCLPQYAQRSCLSFCIPSIAPTTRGSRFLSAEKRRNLDHTHGQEKVAYSELEGTEPLVGRKHLLVSLPVSGSRSS